MYWCIFYNVILIYIDALAGRSSQGFIEIKRNFIRRGCEIFDTGQNCVIGLYFSKTPIIYKRVAIVFRGLSYCYSRCIIRESATSQSGIISKLSSQRYRSSWALITEQQRERKRSDRLQHRDTRIDYASHPFVVCVRTLIHIRVILKTVAVLPAATIQTDYLGLHRLILNNSSLHLGWTIFFVRYFTRRLLRFMIWRYNFSKTRRAYFFYNLYKC